MTFKVGQKVVCIDEAIRADCVQHLPLRPKLNRLYTVRSIHTEPDLEGYGIRLVELVNPSIVWSSGKDKEWSFDSRKFRDPDEIPILPGQKRGAPIGVDEDC